MDDNSAHWKSGVLHQRNFVDGRFPNSVKSNVCFLLDRETNTSSNSNGYSIVLLSLPYT